jgi:hypothetical protein
MVFAHVAPLIRRHLTLLLGTWWPIWLPAIAIAIFWPCAVFFTRVVFDAAHFIEIWLQMAVTTLVVVFLVDFAQQRRGEREVALAVSNVVRSHIMPALDDAANTLERSLSEGNEPSRNDDVRLAARRLEPLTEAFRLLTDMTHDPARRMSLQAFLADFAISRWTTELNEIADDIAWSGDDRRELLAICDDIRSLRTRAESFSAPLSEVETLRSQR